METNLPNPALSARVYVNLPEGKFALKQTKTTHSDPIMNPKKSLMAIMVYWYNGLS
jgi:hypothetical protein